MDNTEDFFKNYRGRYSQYWIERWGLIPELPTSFDNANSVYELVAWLQRAFKNLLDDFQQLEAESEDFKNAIIDLLEYLIPELIRRYSDSAEFRALFITLLEDILAGEERTWVKDLLKELLEVDMREWIEDYLKDLYGLELNETNSQLAQIAINVKKPPKHMVDAKGDGVTNDTDALIEIFKLGGNILIPKGEYRIDATSDLKVVSNSHIIFQKGAKFKLLSHNETNYSMLKIDNVDNVTIVEPVLDGNKSENSATNGEWGHGINILHSENITIISPNIKNVWGDGIYIGYDYYGTSLKRTKTISINNAIVDGARRNGVSVCGGDSINIDGLDVSNIVGANPQAGIDIEPEGEGAIEVDLGKVTISRVNTENCSTGVELLLNKLANKGLTTNLTINGLRTYDCSTGMTIRQLSGDLGGSIELNNPSFIKTRMGAIYVERYKAIDTPPIIINNPTINGFNVLKSTNDYYNHALTFIKLPNVSDNYDVGNVIFNNPVMIDENNTEFKFIFANLMDTNFKINRVFVNNPIIQTTKPITCFMRNNPRIEILDAHKTLKGKSLFYEQILSYSLSTLVSNKGATDWIVYKTEDSHVPERCKVQFKVESNQRVTFRPSTIIQGFTSVGKGIYSANVGDMIEVMYENGVWSVERMIGNWTAEV